MTSSNATASGADHALEGEARQPRPGRSQRLSPGLLARHGLWAPGVRTLRNLSLRLKSLLLIGVVGLPLVLLVAERSWNEWTHYQLSRQRLVSLHQVQALGELASSISKVQNIALQAELGSPTTGLDDALTIDQAGFDAFVKGFESAVWPFSTRAAMDALQVRRQKMLELARNDSRTALPGRASPRFEALAEYAHELTLLRAELARSNGITSDAPLHVRALDHTLAQALPRLRWLLGRSIGLGATLYESNDREERGRRLEVLMTQAELILREIESDLNVAKDHGLIDPGLVRSSLRAVSDQTTNAQRLAGHAKVATSSVELAVSADLAMADYRTSGTAAVRATQALEEAAFESLSAWARSEAEATRSHLIVFVVLMALWTFLATYLVVCTYRVLAGGLGELCRQLEAIGRGNLSQRPKGLGRDEVGQALNALGASMGHMSQLFGAVTQGVAAVSQASREVAGGNAGLSGRTAQVRELIAGVYERADACSTSLDTCGAQVEQTAELVHGMRADGQRSRQAMAGLREGMARLQVKSREIEQVVGLMESVAYQTKLLSINASVEAARAGDAGKGFAVVAQEVRALAVRSEMAARRITGIVDASIEEIESCGAMAERTDEAVRRNEEKIEGVDGLMREAVRLTRAGRSDSQQVLTIARSVEESITGNARVVEQLAEASGSLRTQGDNLKRSVQHFVFG